MSTCDYLLDAAIVGLDCANPIVKGVESDGFIINRADINFAGVTYSTTAANTVTALPLASGASAYTISQPSKTPYSGTQTEMNEGTYQNTFTNTVSFVILNHGNTVVKQVEEIANGEYVVILKNKAVATAASSPWQVYGLQGGLTASSITRELYNDDTLAGWVVSMTESGVSHAGLFVDETVIESLEG